MSRTVEFKETAFVLHTLNAPNLSCSRTKTGNFFFLKGCLDFFAWQASHAIALPAKRNTDLHGHAESHIRLSKVSGFHDPWLQWLIQTPSHVPVPPFHNTIFTPLSSDSLWFAVDAQSSPVVHSFLEQPESRSPSQPRQATRPQFTLSGTH